MRPPKLIGWFLGVTAVLAACSQPKDLIYEDVRNLKIQKAGLNETSMSCEIYLYNPNHYRIRLKNATVNILLNGAAAGTITVDHKYILPASDTFGLPVMWRVDIKNILPDALQILLNKTVSIRLNGIVTAGRDGMYRSIPIDYKKEEQLNLY